jgi:hypothetical protein
VGQGDASRLPAAAVGTAACVVIVYLLKNLGRLAQGRAQINMMVIILLGK